MYSNPTPLIIIELTAYCSTFMQIYTILMQ